MLTHHSVPIHLNWNGITQDSTGEVGLGTEEEEEDLAILLPADSREAISRNKAVKALNNNAPMYWITINR